MISIGWIVGGNISFQSLSLEMEWVSKVCCHSIIHFQWWHNLHGAIMMATTKYDSRKNHKTIGGAEQLLKYLDHFGSRRKVDRRKCCRCTKKKSQRNCHTLSARNENLLPNVMVVVVVVFFIVNTFVYTYEARTDMWTVCLLFFFRLLRALCSVVCRWSMFGIFLTSKMLFIVVVDAGQWIGVNTTSV